MMKGIVLALTSIETQQPTITLQHLVSYYQLMKDHHDSENANKILDLYEKMEQNKFIISFTGHFSAGKSSMINALLGEEILPKSPIPTSANIVEIISGDGSAKVHFIDGGPKIYGAPYDIELIKDFCKDKNTVKKIELSTSNDVLPEGSMIVDTPGIDAADDADRIMTESSLHLVDRLFYVMDYNHVQSDMNLHFLKQIQDKGIPFYIIINQVDKHNENEIPFEAFDKSVKQTFNQWHLKPVDMFYSSLMNPGDVNNEYEKIKDTIFSTLKHADKMSNTITHSTRQLIKAHKEFLKEQYEDNITNVLESNEEYTDISELEKVKDKVMSIKNKAETIEHQFQSNLAETLKNAYLMPASLRDKASLFLESEQKDFKVGLFGSKKKTEIEKRTRLQSFLEDLQKTIESTIQWKLRDKIIALLTEHEVASPDLLRFTEQFSIQVTEEDLRSLIKPGAKINGNYILNYTNDLSSHIKSKYKSQAQNLWEEIRHEVEQKSNDDLAKYEEQMEQLESALEIEQHVQKLKDELTAKMTVIDQELKDPSATQKAWALVESDILSHQPEGEVVNEVASTQQEEIEKVIDVESPQIKKEETPAVHHVIQSISKTIDTIEHLPGFGEFVQDLLNKKDRLENRTLTVALFGAFSAGKSSFANALIGESLLPSSPNPTTAVINRIAPVTKDDQHGTIRIKLKDEDLLLEDLSSMTKDYSPPKTDFDSFIDWMNEKKLVENDELDNIFQSYLQAILNGYEQAKDNIGKTITVSMDDFAEYVTDETKACYIELVTMYYDCPLTRLGITLVDTPGSNSVNARHTNVAFDYIKYADAILYVTYYNHALSRADKDFLMQLGRVKDTFQQDKMFFVINAADLASHTDELDMVTEYVEDQLVQLGIRFPKIFPVSSKQSLDNKLNDEPLNDMMSTFESSFYQFVNEDLAVLSIESALWDMKRAYEWLAHSIESALLMEQDRDQYRLEIKERGHLLERKVSEVDVDLYNERILQRIERQLHYVGERFGIRFHDMFKESFNPTTINQSGQKAIKQLEQSLKHLLDYTGYELLQELRAVSLRVEAFIKDLVGDVYQDLQDRCKQTDEKFLLPMIEIEDLSTPDYDQAFVSLDVQLFNKSIKKFRGTKAFFEKNEKEIMKDDIYTVLEPFVEHYIEENKAIMEQTYVEQWKEVMTDRREMVKQSIRHYIDNHLSMMTDNVDLDLLKSKQKQLESILLETERHGEDK